MSGRYRVMINLNGNLSFCTSNYTINSQKISLVNKYTISYVCSIVIFFRFISSVVLVGRVPLILFLYFAYDSIDRVCKTFLIDLKCNFVINDGFFLRVFFCSSFDCVRFVTQTHVTLFFFIDNEMKELIFSTRDPRKKAVSLSIPVY